MKLLDLIQRQGVPAPWTEGENIPWNDPAFSERMLREHLSQAHDAASRRFKKIDAHVDWIHHALLAGRATTILDLGCGPGLYSNRLARLGHECVGIDFSPASIAYAVKEAEAEDLCCTFLHQDIRTCQYGSGFGLAMLIFGEFNAFRLPHAKTILARAYESLADGGVLLLEPSTFASLAQAGEREPSWYSSRSGLFSDRPHLCLMEHFWDAVSCANTTRYFIVHADGAVSRHAQSLQAYTDEGYRSLLAHCGFSAIEFHPSLTGAVDETQRDFFVIVARKHLGRTEHRTATHRATDSEIRVAKHQQEREKHAISHIGQD